MGVFVDDEDMSYIESDILDIGHRTKRIILWVILIAALGYQIYLFESIIVIVAFYIGSIPICLLLHGILNSQNLYIEFALACILLCFAFEILAILHWHDFFLVYNFNKMAPTFIPLTYCFRFIELFQEGY